MFRAKPLIKCTPDEAEQILMGCAEQIVAVHEMLAVLEGRFTEIIDNYEWESFTPKQRSLFMHWHISCRNSKLALREPHGI